MPAGRYTAEQLERLWRDLIDPEHARSILADPDSALAIRQAFEQLALVSAAIDETTQELYLLPFSGQSSPPAGGAARAAVELTVSRSLRLDEVLILEPGTLVEEVALDAGPSGAVEVLTGRRYALSERLAFLPGEAGPKSVAAAAERLGRGLDWPAPGSLRHLSAPGAGLGNEGASVVPGAPGPHALVAAPVPDAPVPEHDGQTVELTLGANAGQRRRVVGYRPPSPPADAGALLLARDALLRVSGVAGTFRVGEVVTLAGGAAGRLVAAGGSYLVVEVTTLAAAGTGAIVGEESGASAMVDVVELGEAMAAEAGTASWRVLDLPTAYGLTFTNAESPAGGRDAVLDALADERGARRAPGESDEELRARVEDPADAVTPMAVLRAANRALSRFGLEATIREAGSVGMPGIFCDVSPFDLGAYAVAGAFSGFAGGEGVRQPATGAQGVAIVGHAPGLGALTSPTLKGIGRPFGQPFVSGSPIVGSATVPIPIVSGGPTSDARFRTGFSYLDMRAFFLVGVPKTGAGDFGCAFDTHPAGFCDSAPALSFYDGFPATQAASSQAVWQAVDEVRPAGSGFDLVQE